MSNKLSIIIPTFKRVKKQKTFEQLPSYWQAQTYFIANEVEAPKLKRLYGDTGATVIIHPTSIKTIAQKRAWILQQECWDKILMFDDDLRISSRRKEDKTKLKEATKKEIHKSFLKISDKLDELIHVGVHSRFGVVKYPMKGWRINTRAIYGLGYRASVVREVAKLGRVEFREDVELTIQLLSKGYPNAILVDISLDNTFDAPGGVQEQGNRDAEENLRQAEILKKLYPKYVSIKYRKYRSGERHEVIVNWRQAYKDGRVRKGIFQ